MRGSRDREVRFPGSGSGEECEPCEPGSASTRRGLKWSAERVARKSLGSLSILRALKQWVNRKG